MFSVTGGIYPRLITMRFWLDPSCRIFNHKK